MRNLSSENEFCMQFHFHTNQSHFHKNGFALRLALKQRHHKGNSKRPINFTLPNVPLSLSCAIIKSCLSMDQKVTHYEGSLGSMKQAEDLPKAEDAAKDNFSYLSALLTSLVHKNIFN